MKTITVANKTLTKKQWAEYLKIDISVLYKQAKHKPFEEVIWSRLPLHERGPLPKLDKI